MWELEELGEEGWGMGRVLTQRVWEGQIRWIEAEAGLITLLQHHFPEPRAAAWCYMNTAHRGVKGSFYPLMTSVLQPDGTV